MRNPIDAFVLQRLEREGLKPSPEADRATLLRRVSLDLTGLPPTPAGARRLSGGHVAERVREGRRSAAALAAVRRAHGVPVARRGALRRQQRLSDRRRAVHVAVARLGDRRLQSQHALRPVHDRATGRRPAAAMPRWTRRSRPGSIAITAAIPKAASSPKSTPPNTSSIASDTTSTVFLGLTIGCARCHNHKFDPFTQKEFYQLFAYFNNVPEHGKFRRVGNSPPYIAAPLPEQAGAVEAARR